MEEKKGRHSHALHGDEYSEECMRHNVKRKEKHEDSVAVICLSDKIKEKRKTTKSVETMLGVLSRNRRAVGWRSWILCKLVRGNMIQDTVPTFFVDVSSSLSESSPSDEDGVAFLHFR